VGTVKYEVLTAQKEITAKRTQLTVSLTEDKDANLTATVQFAGSRNFIQTRSSGAPVQGWAFCFVDGDSCRLSVL
jgi:hypothetical protein